MIEPPFTFFEKQIDMGFRVAVVTAHLPLCLVPDILDPVDVVFLFGQFSPFHLHLFRVCPF
jgi:hypothetical protein